MRFAGKKNEIEKLLKFSAELSEFENSVNRAIDVMTDDVFKTFEDASNEFTPELMKRYQALKDNIKGQKDENGNLSKQLQLLNQDTYQIYLQVYELATRLQKLEIIAFGHEIEMDKEEEERSETSENAYSDSESEN